MFQHARKTFTKIDRIGVAAAALLAGAALVSVRGDEFPATGDFNGMAVSNSTFDRPAAPPPPQSQPPIVAPPVQSGPPHVPPPPVAPQPQPNFGPLDAGGMPPCLVELRAGGYSEGYLVQANTPYSVWVATKNVGQAYTQAAWSSFGPWTLTGGERYLFRSGGVGSNPRPTATAISPGLASLHVENTSTAPIWYIFNPLPPGCGGSSGGTPPGVDTRGQRTLTVRTQLRPVGWKSGDVLWFGPGTYWVDAFDGGVQSGPLAQSADLKIWNSNNSVSLGPGFIRFERAGGVKEGTLAADTSLCVVNTASNNKMTLTFARNTSAEFGYDGCVMKGTLAQAATLRSWNGGSETYPPGTLIDFNGAGLVTRAVLPPGAATKVDGAYNGTCAIVGLATVPYVIRASNGVFSGTRDSGLYSLQWQGNYDPTGTIQNGLMTGWVDVIEGGGKTRWTVRGPLTGTLAAAALTITTADGKRTWTGSCGASGPVGTAPVGPGGASGKPVLRIDLSPLDNLRTGQTFTLTAIAENIPASAAKLKFSWYLHLSDGVSADPPGSKANLWYIQFVTPVNGKATASITVRADSSPRETGFQLFVQEEPYTKIVFLSASKDYSIKVP